MQDMAYLLLDKTFFCFFVKVWAIEKAIFHIYNFGKSRFLPSVKDRKNGIK